MPMNTANKLTLARVFMIPLFLVIVYWGFPGSRYVALGVYILACLTDLLDGYVARHYNQVSDFGKFADPLADKCLVMAALCWFVETGDMVGWVLAVVLLFTFCVRLIGVDGHSMEPTLQHQDRLLILNSLFYHGEGPGHRRRLVRQGQDRQHHGVHLPDALRHPPLAESGVPGRHSGDHRLLRRGVLRQKLGRIPREQVTVSL